MSKLAFDYSKWDNLDTDDSDAEEPKAPIHEEDGNPAKGLAAPRRPDSSSERSVEICDILQIGGRVRCAGF